MSEMVFQPSAVAVRNGARLPQSMRDDPARVVSAFYDAVKVNGLVGDVVAAASDKANPMHDFFTWDDLEAADKQRVREAFLLGGSFVDTKTGEPIFVSTYRLTNDSADAGRIHINVRLLEPEARLPTAERRAYVVQTAGPAAPVVAPPPTPRAAAAPQAGLPARVPIDAPPPSQDGDVIDDPAIGIFTRWVAAHKHERAVLLAAYRILRDAL